MSGGVHRQGLIDFADGSNLFQITVHHLIAEYRKQYAFLGCFLVALIFLNDGEGNIEQRDVAHLLCLLPGFAYPFVAVIISYDIR